MSDRNDSGSKKEDRDTLHALHARAEAERSVETLADTALKEIPSSRQKRVSLLVSGDNLSNSGSSQSRPPLERRKSVALARIIETLSTVERDSEAESFEFSSSLNDENGVPSRSRSRLHRSLESDEDLQHPSVGMFLRRVIQEEFPAENNPTLRDLIHCGKNRDKASLYKPGDWVEIQGAEMKWTLEMITRVVKQAPSDWDWNDRANEDKDPDWEYFYHAGYRRMLTPEELRSPKEGLLHLFGTRPFLWQQWVCLKLEQTLRFQKGHQDDFEWKDTEKFALDYWERWLHHPKNADFFEQFYDDRIGDFGRRQLVDHIMSPFQLMETIKHDDERWNFMDDDSISVYSYLSIFGTVFVLPCVIVLLQFSIPALLFLHLDYSDGESEGERGDLCQGFDNLVWYGTVGEECEINRVAQMMAITVLGYYLFKVVPDVFASFYNVLGSAGTPYSKLQSLRSQIWDKREDRPGQIMGFQMDVYMNTCYVCVLYMLNILVIINTDNAFEIVLNALAFEFVINLDHEFAKSAWWDAERRWVKCGAIELLLQNTIQTKTLSSPKMFSSEFQVPVVELEFRDTDGKTSKNLLKDKTLAAKDVEDEKYMTNDEKIKNQCKKIAIETQNKHAIDEYKKQDVDFGTATRAARYITKRKGGGVFDRHAAFRTWSRWETVLYLPPLPDLDLVFDHDAPGSARVKTDLSDVVSTSKAPFANFQKVNQTDPERFRSKYVKVITLVDSFRTIKSVWKHRSECGVRRSLVVLFFDGPIKVFAFMVQRGFPIL